MMGLLLGRGLLALPTLADPLHKPFTREPVALSEWFGRCQTKKLDGLVRRA